ncbi:MAG: VanZ family protein [Candidatus Binataceae bacterium]
MLASWIIVILVLGSSLFSYRHTSAIVDPLIVFVSPRLSLAQATHLKYFIRWSAHFIEYGVLFLILILGPFRGRPLAAFVACLMCACLDEGLQTFDPARTGSILDVGLDASGAAAAMLVPLSAWAFGKSARWPERISPAKRRGASNSG